MYFELINSLADREENIIRVNRQVRETISPSYFILCCLVTMT